MVDHVGNTPLGKDTQYPDQYDPGLLCPIPRSDGRKWINEYLAESSELPFKGVDYWNAYEVSWLNAKGKPEVGVLELSVPCDSPNIVESKSLKLYLNSLNHCRFANVAEVVKTLEKDIEAVIGAAVDIKLHTDIDHEEHYQVAVLKGENIDHLDVTVDHFQVDRNILSIEGASGVITETLCSHLLRSNCPVTGQPDWASVVIRYKGKPINKSALLRYIISYRTHNEFHEQCVERIFMDILQVCGCEQLTVYARYTRRGGIDINPFRSNFELPYPNARLMRQ